MLATVALAFLLPVLVSIAINVAFGYDEAVYAQLSRHWLFGSPASGWGVHRPPVLSAFGTLPLLLGSSSEWTFRLFGAISGVLTVGAVWWLARQTGGRVAGLIAAVTLAAAAPLQVESGSFLTDVPSTFVLLLLTALIWRHLSSDEPIGPSFVWLAPLAAAAFYLRYGAIIAIGGLALAAIAVGHRKMRVAWHPVALAVLIFGLLLIPHLVVAQTVLGAPWGIVASAQSAARGTTTPPLISYLGWYPWQLIGPLGAAVASIGVVAVVRSAIKPDRAKRAAQRVPFGTFLGIGVLAQMAILGTVVHAEPRYAFFAMSLLVVLGAGEIARFIERETPRAWLAPAAAGLGVAGLALGAALTTAEVQQRADLWDWKRVIGEGIGTEVRASGSAPCSVLTADVPIIGWYSGCQAVNFLSGPSSGRLELLRGTHRYVVVRADGHLQPPDPVLARDITSQGDVWRTFQDGYGRVVATVYRVPAAAAP